MTAWVGPVVKSRKRAIWSRIARRRWRRRVSRSRSDALGRSTGRVADHAGRTSDERVRLHAVRAGAGRARRAARDDRRGATRRRVEPVVGGDRPPGREALVEAGGGRWTRPRHRARRAGRGGRVLTPRRGRGHRRVRGAGRGLTTFHAIVPTACRPASHAGSVNAGMERVVDRVVAQRRRRVAIALPLFLFASFLVRRPHGLRRGRRAPITYVQPGPPRPQGDAREHRPRARRPRSTTAPARSSSPRFARRAPPGRSTSSDIPPVMVDATTAIEDKSFWENAGFDPLGIVSAGIDTIRGRERGASTITQQLVRARLLPPSAFEEGVHAGRSRRSSSPSA